LQTVLGLPEWLAGKERANIAVDMQRRPAKKTTKPS